MMSFWLYDSSCAAICCSNSDLPRPGLELRLWPPALKASPEYLSFQPRIWTVPARPDVEPGRRETRERPSASAPP